jgi:hypothetical protein
VMKRIAWYYIYIYVFVLHDCCIRGNNGRQVLRRRRLGLRRCKDLCGPGEMLSSSMHAATAASGGLRVPAKHTALRPRQQAHAPPTTCSQRKCLLPALHGSAKLHRCCAAGYCVLPKDSGAASSEAARCHRLRAQRREVMCMYSHFVIYYESSVCITMSTSLA